MLLATAGEETRGDEMKIVEGGQGGLVSESVSAAYDVGGRVARDRISREDPVGAEAIRRLEASDIVVVPGSYDHVEAVLGALDMPYERVSAQVLEQVSLRPEQLLVVNCPGHVPPRAIERVRDFVDRGGSLFSTDWALQNLIEPAFPGTIEYNRRPTRDDVVRIEIAAERNRFLQGVIDQADEPVWWLEASSYPIRLLDPDRVDVLLTSRELEAKYGEAPVAVIFRHGDGEVFHMISHYYLQRTELRSERQSGEASAYVAEKGLSMDADLRARVRDLRLGDVESAAASARLFANVVAEKKARSMRKR